MLKLNALVFQKTAFSLFFDKYLTVAKPCYLFIYSQAIAKRLQKTIPYYLFPYNSFIVP